MGYVGSYYNMPKAIFYLLTGDYKLVQGLGGRVQGLYGLGF